jgi:putative membrane protein
MNHDQENREHSGVQSAVDKMQDAIGGAVGFASATTAGSHSTAAFASNALQSNRYEIDAARIALERGRSAEVRSMAQEMIDVHTGLGERLVRQLENAGVSFDPHHDLDQRRRGMLDNLKTASADEFDRRYIDQQVLAHQETIKLFEGYSEHGGEPSIKAAAAEALPVLEKHLDRAKGLQGR